MYLILCSIAVFVSVFGSMVLLALFLDRRERRWIEKIRADSEAVLKAQAEDHRNFMNGHGLYFSRRNDDKYLN